MGVRENKIEKYLVDEVEKLGGLCYKFVSPGRVGVPDRIIVLDGHTIFVEVKSPEGVISDIQIREHKKIISSGGDVTIVGDNSDVDCLIIHIKTLNDNDPCCEECGLEYTCKYCDYDY